MDDNSAVDILGKKIFFVHPPAFIQNEVITELAQQEFEVYVIKDESKMSMALRHYPNSIAFASVDETLQGRDWETLIKQIMTDPATKNAALGIIVMNNNEDIKRQYLTIGVSCGYVAIKPDTNKALKQILEILKAAEAKGRRKYIRADTKGDTNITVNLSLDGRYVNGHIQDISVVGFSCIFDTDPGLQKNTLFSDIQLKLQSQLLKVEGIVFGFRMDGDKKNYIFVFTPKTDPAVRTKIRSYMQKFLQGRIDQELK